MKLFFCLRDSKAEYCMDPVLARTRAEAIRSLEKAVRDQGSDISAHAEDFALFELGSFDPVTGAILAHVQKVHVMDAVDLKPYPVQLPLSVSK